MIPMGEMVPRGVYRIHSRNLVVGVWDGKSGFIGIREKFYSNFLFKEYHWETGAPYGTAKPSELITTVPEGIDIQEGYGPEEYKRLFPEKYKGEYHYNNNALQEFLEPYEVEENKRIDAEYKEKYGRFEAYEQREKDADEA